MATPAVAGIAALLMDAVPSYRRQPALARARLMASAIKPAPWLEAPSQFPADNTNTPGPLQHRYGLGKASARTAVLNRNAADGWTSGSAVSELADGEYAWQDIAVPAGASRLDLVLAWDEPPAESIGTPVLNDLDLWLDHGADCGAGACGERSSLSNKDNVEWIIVRQPAGRHPPCEGGGAARLRRPAQGGAGVDDRARAGHADAGTQRRQDRLERQRRASAPLVAERGRLRCRRRQAHHRLPGRGRRRRLRRRFPLRLAGRARGRRLDSGPQRGARGGRNEITPIDINVNFADEAILPLGEVAAGENQRVSFTVSLSDAAPRRAVRLYFTASAWNAQGASMFVELLVDGDSREGTAVAPPANDDFAAAAAIAGAAGERPFDALRATTEAGELLFQPRSIDVAHSLWYSWRAPTDGLFRFDIGERSGRVDVLRGDRLAALRRVAFGNAGTAFFATAQERYLIRLAMPARNAPGMLRWGEGRPPNDDLAAAERIAGESGSYEGSTLGAGMESGEWFGAAAASVWHRWTAPRTATFAFGAQGGHRTMVFAGGRMADLRLVSGWPNVDATFPAEEGREYRIAVAAADGTTVEGTYTLTWQGTAADDTNNQFASALALPGQSSAAEELAIDERSNVEPSEPAATGVRTNWWTWRAPSSGRITFRLANTAGLLFRIAAFTGSSVAALRLAGASDAYDATPEFTLDARADERYGISLGFVADDISAFETIAAKPLLEWAPTPPNDSLAAALRIGGSRGSATGNNRYATTEGGESSRDLGHSSLWWDFEAPDSASYRFEATGRTLAVYRRAGDGFDDLELVASGRGRVTFGAVAGRRYAVRVGSRGEAGGDFTLRWTSQSTNGGTSHVVPLFLAVDNDGARTRRPGCELPASNLEQEQREGFVRIVNPSAEGGTVRIHAVDDAGRPGREAVTLDMDGNQTRHFNSGDLELGNPAKGLSGAVGDGQGDWHLRLESDLPLKVYAYARTKPGGFLTSLLDSAPCEGRHCQLDFFNPASNRDQCSLLRIVNPGDSAVAVTVTGKDDAGTLPGSAVSFEVPAQAARTLTARDLEEGSGAGVSGALGDGQGKWQLAVAADQPILAMSLLESPAMLLTNLSATAPDS